MNRTCRTTLWALAAAAIVPLLAQAGPREDPPRPAPANADRALAPAGPGWGDPRLQPRRASRAALAEPELHYLPGQLLVGFRPGVTPLAKAQAAAFLGARLMRDLGRINVQQWRLPRGMTPEEGSRHLAASPHRFAIAFSEPNFVIDMASHENEDTYLPVLWGMHNVGQTAFYGYPGSKDADIDAPQAWSAGGLGSPSVKVAVIDTGVDYNHPDLAANVNASLGYDFVNSDADAMDDNGHGTHVAGIIGARGDNGLGVKGVSPLVTIIPIKALNGGGSGDAANLAAAINHATTVGAHVINASWGSSSESKSIKSAISKFPGLFVAAAGNTGSDAPQYPAASALANIIAVAATEDKDRCVGWSTFGTWVHIAAPGVDILSTYPTQWGAYVKMSGTSMAAPHVAGAAAQVLAKEGLAFGYAALKNRLISTADPRLTVDGGLAPSDDEFMTPGYERSPRIRLNLARALGVEPGPPGQDNIIGPGAPSQITDLNYTLGADGVFTLTWTAPGSPDASPAYAYDLRGRMVAQSGDLLLNWDKTWNGWFLPKPGHAGGAESFTLQGFSPIPGRKYELAIRTVDVAGNASLISTVLLVNLPGSSTWDVEVAAPYGLYWVAQAYDSSGKPSVAYLDEDPAVQGPNGKPVAIVTRSTSGTWVREVVPGSDGAHYSVGLGYSPTTGLPAVTWRRYVSWGQGYAIFISMKQTDGTWKSWQIDYGGNSTLVFEPGTNNPAIIYPKNGSVLFARIVNGSVVKESAHRNANGIRYKRLAYAPDGTAGVVYSRDLDSDGYIDGVSLARRVAGKWVTEVVESGVIGYGVSAALGWNPIAGRWAIVHANAGTQRFLQRNPSGGWSAPELIPGDWSSIAFKADGTAVVGHMYNRFGYGNIAATTRSPQGAWSSPDIIEYGDWTADYISPAVFGAGDVTICWGGGVIAPDGSSRWGVKYAKPKP